MPRVSALVRQAKIAYLEPFQGNRHRKVERLRRGVLGNLLLCSATDKRPRIKPEVPDMVRLIQRFVVRGQRLLPRRQQTGRQRQLRVVRC
jgi:hypothetical protein